MELRAYYGPDDEVAPAASDTMKPASFIPKILTLDEADEQEDTATELMPTTVMFLQNVTRQSTERRMTMLRTPSTLLKTDALLASIEELRNDIPLEPVSSLDIQRLGTFVSLFQVELQKILLQLYAHPEQNSASYNAAESLMFDTQEFLNTQEKDGSGAGNERRLKKFYVASLQQFLTHHLQLIQSNHPKKDVLCTRHIIDKSAGD